MGDNNGTKQNKKIDAIHDKVDFVSDSIVPLSTAINHNTNAVEENSRSINNLATHIQHFFEYHVKASDKDREERAEIYRVHRMDMMKMGGVLFILLFAALFGVKEIPQLVRVLL